MCSKMLLYYIMLTENKKEYYKNYYLANKDKLNAKRRDKYLAKKNNEINRMRKINGDIKKDVEILKEKFRLLYGDCEDVNINILIIVTK